MLTSRSQTLVIGVGNAYRSDDAVGLIVAQRLKQCSAEPVIVLEESGAAVAWMDAWKDADAVILIDAAHSGADPGTIHRLDAGSQPLPPGILRYSTHGLGIAEGVELARALNQLPKRCIVYGIEGRSFAAGVGLSPEVEQAAEQVVLRVLHDLRDDP